MTEQSRHRGRPRRWWGTRGPGLVEVHSLFERGGAAVVGLTPSASFVPPVMNLDNHPEEPDPTPPRRDES